MSTREVISLCTDMYNGDAKRRNSQYGWWENKKGSVARSENEGEKSECVLPSFFVMTVLCVLVALLRADRLEPVSDSTCDVLDTITIQSQS